MKYTKKDLASYNLHLINTDKFKTITMKVVFSSPIKKDEITMRNVLSDLLLQSSKNYESRRELTIKAEELYAADIYNNTQRIGNYILTSFNLQVLNDKYTEEGNFEEAVKFLSEIIFNPDIKDNGFKEDKLDLVLSNVKVALESIKEDATNYSLLRLMEAYDKDSPVSYRMVGYLEDLDKIKTDTLYEYYKNLIEYDYVDIYIVGDFENNTVQEIIKKYFKFRKVKRIRPAYNIDSKKIRRRRLLAKETIDNNQSKLAIACAITKASKYEINYPLVLANIIYGGGPDSKLFKDVREKNSLCYSIYSYPVKLDNLLVISAGIDKENYQKTLDLTTDLLKDMKKGKFTDKDINIAKEYYNTACEEVEESEYKIINEYLSQEILGVEPLEERVKIMNKVTKKDIIKVAKKIEMDTVFLLEGVREDERD